MLSFTQSKVLLTLIWLRRYPTMHHISTHFGITTSSVHRFIHKILRLMHVYVVPRYIRLHSMNTWNQLQGYFEHWPKVVAVVDGTPFRISKPKGLIQRLFWRKDRHCFFMNWIVISDVQGFIVFSRPGFIGHLHDSTCYRWGDKVFHFVKSLFIQNICGTRQLYATYGGINCFHIVFLCMGNLWKSIYICE